jgi:hypothetical protein
MSKYVAVLSDTESKFAGWCKTNSVDPQRVLVASTRVERLRSEDRSIRLAKRQARGKEDEAAKAARSKKPRSGRPVTDRLLTSALRGASLTGPQKTRLLRAVSYLVTQKKLAAVTLDSLF